MNEPLHRIVEDDRVIHDHFRRMLDPARETSDLDARRSASGLSERDGILIAVSDSGGGVPLAIRHKIFDPSFTTKAPGRGSGQGLAMARSVVVERHRGSLGFESEEGRGTTFFIRLPTEATLAGAS